MTKNYRLWFALLFSILLTSALPGCSNRGVESDNNSASVNMNLKIASPGMVDAISQFQVIVTADDINPAIEVRLLLVGRYLYGVVLIPPGKNRTITVEARDYEGSLLYQGDTTLSLTTNEVVQLTIGLYPVISLVRISPRYLEVPLYSDFFVDVRAFNVEELYGITFRLHWQGSVVYPDSAKSLLPPGRELIWVDRIESNLQYYEISISNTDQTNPIVDVNGDADLARVYFSTVFPESIEVGASLMIEVMEMTRLPDATIPLDSVKVDGSTVIVGLPEF
jgi:hypothetical protein